MGLRTMGRQWPPRRWVAALLVSALCSASCNAFATQKSASFMVVVDLLSDPKTGVCERTAATSSAPIVTLTCNVSTPRPQPDSRFLLNIYEAGHYLGSVDGMMSTGTVTSWRVINLPKRDYLEIMVGW